ncbi:MAG: hypothetical protein LBQ44_02315 [Treponema sp.]|jgi:hypothetical protein|nr:hypothetical protein [Treponema sp.]
MIGIMRKPLVPRIVLLPVVYAFVFLVIVQIQFAQKKNFTLQPGNLVVSGRYGGEGTVRFPGVYPLEGDISVFFGGMEFMLAGDEGFALSGPGGTVRAAAESMILSDNGVHFQLAGGPALGDTPELSFTTQYSGGALVLVIRGSFGGAYEGPSEAENEEPGEGAAGSAYTALALPYTPLRTSTIREGGVSFIVNSGGTDYAFNRNAGTGGLIRLEAENPVISYQAVSGQNKLGPRDFIMTGAENGETFEPALALWLDSSYSAWNRTVSQGEALNSETAAAYMSESLQRGTYRASSAAVSAVYTPEPGSYEASAYVGRTDAALRSLSAAERERSARLARVFNEKSLDFLKEFHVVLYLGIRGYSNLLDDVAEMLRGMDPAALTVDQCAGILEGHPDWALRRPGRENPFAPFVDQAVYVVTGALKKNLSNGTSLIFTGEEADTEYCLRIGSALSNYEDETTKALGRTLILSVLTLTDSSGSAPRTVIRNSSGDFAGKPGSPPLSSARMYKILNTPNGAGYFARAQAISAESSVPGGLWAWTAASSVSAVQQNGITDITVNFPAGETHYMIIRGVRPFRALQLYNTDYPTDSQFERYDSSGWVYSAAEQSLLVKMRHRSASEHIRIISP